MGCSNETNPTQLLLQLKALLEASLSVVDGLMANSTLPGESSARNDPIEQLTEVLSSITEEIAQPVRSSHSTTRVSRSVESADYAQGKRHRRHCIFEQLEQVRDQFTDTQWTVLSLYYSEGLPQLQIAERLGCSRSAVYKVLRRARERKQDYERQMRAEQFALARKHIQS